LLRTFLYDAYSKYSIDISAHRDWWGYNDPSDYDTKTGAQMAAVMAMAQKIASAAAPVS
jgi:hypothetical protein